MKTIEILKGLFDGKNWCKVEKKDTEGSTISVTFKKNDPINNSKFESSLLYIIPKEYVELLSFSNGMELFNYDDIDGLKLLSLQEIENYTSYGKKTFEEDWQDNILFFAKIIGEDNYLGFRIDGNKYEIVDCYFEELPSEWRSVSDKLDDFLEKYIVKNGEMFWIN